MLKIWFSKPEMSIFEPKPNIFRNDLKLKTQAGRQEHKNQRARVLNKELNICWPTKLQTPKPVAAKIIPATPESTLATRLACVFVLKLICLARMVSWIRPKELITRISDNALVKGVRVGWL